MNGWAPWRRAEPDELLRFVHIDALAAVMPAQVRLPGRSGAPPEVRLRQLFTAFAAAGVRYADEVPGEPGEQDIRPPDQIFTRPGVANCLDLAVAFAGGCLDAGLHSMIVSLAPATGPARHAIVVVWLRGDLGSSAYPLSRTVQARVPRWPGMGLRTTAGEPGEFVAIDIARVARGWPDEHATAVFDDAVAAAGRMLSDGSWTWDVGIDVGLGHGSVEPYALPGRPVVAPLDEPYHHDARADDTKSPLESVRARNRIVPFESRSALDALRDWCLAPDSEPGRMRMTLVHGVGGAGKTRLAAELAQRLIDEERWYAGFLRRELTRKGAAPDDVAWLAGVVGPVLVVIDYVEQADPATLATQLKILDGRRGRTAVLLTARSLGDWRDTLDKELGERGVVVDASFPDTHLDALHPNAEVVYRRAYRRFSPVTGAPDTPPELPSVSTRWTTLDVVMIGWLMARAPDIGLPADRTALYERILGREFTNWNGYLSNRFGREADETALRRCAAVVSLLSPSPDQVIPALKAAEVPDLTSLALGELTGMLTRFLADTEEEVLALQPDPLADHLIVTQFRPDRLFDQCIDVIPSGSGPDSPGVIRLVDNITRAAACDAESSGRLAACVLDRHPLWWPAALGAAWTQGGPFVTPLEDLARRDDSPLPMAQLAEQVPLGHGALGRLALLAAQHVVDHTDPGSHDEQSQSRLAGALNNLSNRQGGTGDRTGALNSITEAVTIRRQLAKTNPAAFLPDLAGSLLVSAELVAAEDGTTVAARLWEDAGAGLSAAVRARLLVYRSGWHRDRGEQGAAASDLARAARLIDGEIPGEDLTQLSIGRQHVRAALADLDRLDAADLPIWATLALSDELVDLADSWMSGEWPERRRILTDQRHLVDRCALRALATVYCDRPALREWLDLLDAIDQDGPETVISAMDSTHATMKLVSEWISTPSWNASQAFLTQYAELCRPEVHAALERLSGDPTARQHLAILRLVTHMPAGAVFDAILDPTDARELLFTVARRGSAEEITEVWFATPRLGKDPFAGPLATALIYVLGDDPDGHLDDIDEAAGAAVEAASTRDRRDVLALLSSLARTRNDRAGTLTRIEAAFTKPASL
ncbi:MAG: hypothetical protein JO100_00200 [Pseudonocardia sp.]|nr:hypothetical protein [Pseudonocardia sp.]